jgi:hypothetical protein
MEASGNTSFLPLNVINDSVFKIKAFLNEESKQFIHFAFEEIQIARAKSISLNEKETTVSVILKTVKCDVFDDELGDSYGTQVKDFFKHHCNIDTKWDEPCNDCTQVYITIAKESNFLSKNYIETVLDSTVKRFLERNMIKIKDHEKVRSFIQTVFTNLLEQKSTERHWQVCYTSICKGSKERKILNLATPFFKDHCGMKVSETQIEGYRADCTMTTRVDNPCFLKSNTPKGVWTTRPVDNIKNISSLRRTSSQTLNEKKPQEGCSCIIL